MSKEHPVLKFFGEKVRDLRKQRQLSQEDFAFKCDLDRTYVSDIELGKRNIGLINVESIAAALDVPVAKLFIGLASAGSKVEKPASEIYRIRDDLRIECGFNVSASEVGVAATLTSAQLEALPFTLFQSIDLKSLSGMVGALFASNLARQVGAIVNPIEKGHPDILPASAADATEQQLRNYPAGLEIKCTVGNVAKNSKLKPGQPRIRVLTGITWQAHHREVTGFLGLIVDFAGSEDDGIQFPMITAAYYSNQLVVEDWGTISGTTGRNTKVTGLRSSGKTKLASGWLISLKTGDYDTKYRKALPLTAEISDDE